MHTAGTLTYQPIYFFGHHDKTAQDTFVSIHTNSTTLHLTPDHHIPVCSAPFSGCHSFDAFRMVPASSVRVGQVLVVLSAGEPETHIVLAGEPTWLACCRLLQHTASLAAHTYPQPSITHTRTTITTTTTTNAHQAF